MCFHWERRIIYRDFLKNDSVSSQHNTEATQRIQAIDAYYLTVAHFNHRMIFLQSFKLNAKLWRLQNHGEKKKNWKAKSAVVIWYLTPLQPIELSIEISFDSKNAKTNEKYFYFFFRWKDSDFANCATKKNLLVL